MKLSLLSIFASFLIHLPLPALAGFSVYNQCPYTVYYTADMPSTAPPTPGAFIQGSIAPSGRFQEPYIGDGRAFKLYTGTSPPGALLVVGYSYNPSDDEFVWSSLNSVNGYPFEGVKLVLTCTNPNPGAVVWQNGVPGSTGTISCTPPGPGVSDLIMILCAS